MLNLLIPDECNQPNNPPVVLMVLECTLSDAYFALGEFDPCPETRAPRGEDSNESPERECKRSLAADVIKIRSPSSMGVGALVLESFHTCSISESACHTRKAH